MSLQEREHPPHRSTLSYLAEIVRRISPLGISAFGGPNVNILLFRRLFVDGTDPWVDERTFADLFSLSSALPGPGSTQLLFSMALARGGVLAGILGFLLWSLPGAIGMLLLSLGVKRIPSTLPPLALALLTGLNSAAVGLIVCAGVQLTKSTSKTRLTRVILFATASVGSCYSAVWLLPVLTFSGGLLTLVGSWSAWGKLKRELGLRLTKRSQDGDEGDIGLDEFASSTRTASQALEPDVALPTPANVSQPLSTPSEVHLRRRTTRNSSSAVPEEPEASIDEPLATPIRFRLSLAQTVLLLGGFLSVVVIIVTLREKLRTPPLELQLFTNLFIAGSILFGGGPVVVPLLQGYTVVPGWVSSKDFLFGFAVLQAFPGPNFNFAVFLGALTLPHNPVLGGFLAYVGIYTPGMLLKLAVLPTYSRFREHKAVRSSLTGLNAAASGLIWTAVYRVWVVGRVINPQAGTEGSRSLDQSGYWVSVAGAAVIATQTFSIPPVLVVLGGAVAGVLYGAVKGAP